MATLAETVHDDEAIRDDGWVEKTKKRAKIETDKMEAELKGYKNNLIKESIRVCIPFSYVKQHESTNVIW